MMLVQASGLLFLLLATTASAREIVQNRQWFKLQESSFSFLQLLPLQERSSKIDNGSVMDRDLAVVAVPAAAAAAAGVMAVDLDLARDFMAPTMASELMALHMVLLTALHMGLPTAPDC